MPQLNKHTASPFPVRQRLNQVFANALKQQQSCFVCGLAGSGKTVAIQHYLATLPENTYLYFSCEPADNDLAHFQQTLLPLQAQFSHQALLVFDQFEVIQDPQMIDLYCQLSQQYPCLFISHAGLPEAFEKRWFIQQLTLIEGNTFFFLPDELAILDLDDQIALDDGWICPALYQQKRHPDIPQEILHQKRQEAILSIIEDLGPKARYYLALLSHCEPLTVAFCQSISPAAFQHNFLNLCRLGLLQADNQTLHMIPIVKHILQHDPLSDEHRQHLVSWYQEHHQIKDMLACMLPEEQKTYITQHYPQLTGEFTTSDLPFLQSLLNPNDPPYLYLAGSLALFQQDYLTFNQVIQTLKEKEQSNQKLIFNLYLLANPTLAWQMLASTSSLDIFSFYYHTCSYINGLQDLSTFDLLTRNQSEPFYQLLNQKSHTDKTCLTLMTLECYHLYGEDALCIQRLEKLLPEIKEPEHFAVISHLIYDAYFAMGLPSQAKQYYALYQAKVRSSNRQDLQRDMDRLNVEHAILENRAEVISAYLATHAPAAAIHFQNLADQLLIARCQLYLKKYEAAGFTYSQLIHYLSNTARTIDYATALFGYACALHGDHRYHEATKLCIEAFSVIGPYRYTALFTTFGQIGVTLLKQYRELMSIKKTGKKKSYENHLWISSYDRYLDVICNQAEFLAKTCPQGETIPAPIEKLTPKETLVLRYLSEGYPNKEIGNLMHISLPTVKTHVSNIFAKLNVKTRTQAINKANELHLL